MSLPLWLLPFYDRIFFQPKVREFSWWATCLLFAKTSRNPPFDVHNVDRPIPLLLKHKPKHFSSHSQLSMAPFCHLINSGFSGIMLVSCPRALYGSLLWVLAYQFLASEALSSPFLDLAILHSRVPSPWP